LSADEKTRLRAEAREKWLWDEAARKRRARREERTDIARRMLRMRMTWEDIAKATGLAETDVERLAAEEGE
jgi:hypothetical protein